VTGWVEGNGHRTAGLPRPGAGRRRSMVILAGLLVTLPTAYLVSTVAGGDWRTATSVRVLQTRGVVYLSNLRVFLVHTDQGPLALSALSPHEGHRVLYCPWAMAFQEAHGAVFDRRGLALDGPVSRGLDRVAVRVAGRLVQVDPSEVEPGPPRGEGPTEEVSALLCRVPGPEDPPGFAAARLNPR
jgi:hypothetical protein